MKKLLYIIPMLLLFFITSEIYGFSFVDYDGTTIESQFDPYDYINEYNYYIVDYAILSSSDGTYKSYNFYFFETQPSYNGTSYWDGEDGSGFCYQISKYKDGLMYYFDNTLTGSNSYYTDSNGIKHYYKYYVPVSMFSSGNFITNNENKAFYHNFDITYNGKTRYAELYEDLKPVTVEVICEYTDDFSSCNIDFKYPSNTILYYEFNSVVENKYTDEERNNVFKTGNPIRYFNKYNNNSINWKKNDNIYWCLADLNGNELSRGSYKINKIISNSTFSCNFIHGQGEIRFMPYLHLNMIETHDIYFTYTATDSVKLSDDSTSNEISSGTSLESGKFYKFKILSNNSTNINLIFEIRDKETGNVVLTRGFKVLVQPIGSSSVINSSTNGKTDSTINYGGESGFTGDSLQGDIDSGIYDNGEFNLENALSTTKNFFNNSIGFFSLVISFLNMFPSWLYTPIYIFLIMVVIVSIIHLIRG